MTRTRLLVPWLAAVALAPLVSAAGDGPVAMAGLDAAGSRKGELEQVEVVGKTPHELQREAIQAEDRFYRRYNTLNTRDDFDIHCRMDKATGTIVPKRQCRIQFLENALAMDSREFLMGLGTGGPGVNTPIAVLQPLWLQRREEYRQTARALLANDPELLTLATEWVRLRERYDRVLKDRQKYGFNLFE